MIENKDTNLENRELVKLWCPHCKKNLDIMIDLGYGQVKK